MTPSGKSVWPTRLMIPVVSAGKPDVTPEVRDQFARQFRSLLHLHTKACRYLDHRDLLRRRDHAAHLDVEAEKLIGVGFAYGYALRDVANRVRISGIAR